MSFYGYPGRQSYLKSNPGIDYNGIMDDIVFENEQAVLKPEGTGFKIIVQICVALVLLGALNWGVYGISGLINPNAQFDLINTPLRPIHPLIPNIIFTLVGVAFVVLIYVILTRKVRHGRVMSDPYFKYNAD